MKCSYVPKICSRLTTKDAHYALILTAAVSLGIAYIAEYGFGILPCDFCLYERFIYASVIIVGLLSLKTDYLGGYNGIILYLLVLSIGIVLAVYHVGVEQHWWAGPAHCTGGGNAATLEEFRAQLKASARPRCDKVSWTILGVSASWWNLILQTGLTFLACCALYLPTKPSAP